MKKATEEQVKELVPGLTTEFLLLLNLLIAKELKKRKFYE